MKIPKEKQTFVYKSSKWLAIKQREEEKLTGIDIELRDDWRNIGKWYRKHNITFEEAHWII